ncbi:NLR family CARD domain-containing protein 4-like [Patiria miniata]|uniref:NACHT domain-containing protein n=1 Tax=Patiria miniata TaxID=46514 RepID=A0A913ZMX4_PATMI|nr:NLR family CARD domain-containing protein 4-like [Patiria miniata]
MATSDNMTSVPAAPTALKPTPAGSGLTAGEWTGVAIGGFVVVVIGLILAWLRFGFGDNVIGRCRGRRNGEGRQSHSNREEDGGEQGIPNIPSTSAGKTNATRSKAEQRRAERAAGRRCRKALKEIYTSTGSYVQMLPWVDDDKRHIMDIYTKLQLKKGDNDLKGEVQSYWDIFKLKTSQGHSIIRAILRGWAGLGKTTLIEKIAYDWACGTVNALKKYKLVFVLKMHSLQQKSDVIEAVFDQLLDEKTINREDLKSFIKSNPEDVLFLLDGFDEFKSTKLDKTEFGSILKMLNRKGEYKKCVVLVTTRPSHYDKLVKNSLIEKPFALVEVLGFSKDDIKEYVHKYYSQELPKAKGLLERITSSDVLTDLAQSPMLLLLMCLLWSESATLPDTMFRLYNEALRYIFKRKTQMSTEEISKFIIAIGKVGLDGLLSSDQKLSFPEEDFESDVLDMAIRAGILTSQREFPNDVSRLISSLRLKEMTQLNIVRFNECVPTRSDMEHIIGELGNLPNLVELDLSGRRTLAGSDQPWSHLKDIKTLNTLALQQCGLKEDDLEHIAVGLSNLPNLVELDLSYNETLAGSGRSWSHLREIKSLNKLNLRCCKLGSDDLEPIAVWLSNLPNLVELDLTGNETLAGSGRSWSHLREIKSLNKLNLISCNLQSDDLEPIAVGLSNLPNLVELDLTGNKTLAGSGRAWSHLREIKSLNKLNLRYCKLGSDDLEPIAVGLSNLPNLVELDLSGNETLAGSGRAWSHLREIKSLNKLNPRCCKLGSDDLEPIAVGLSNLPNLVELDLSGNETLAGSGRAWSHLREIKSLNKLNLRSCKLQSDDLEPIDIWLSDLPNLVKLDLSRNGTLAGSGRAWSHFREIKSLNKLDLSSCGLKSDDLELIAVGLSNLPNIVELDLSDNETLAGSGIQTTPTTTYNYPQPGTQHSKKPVDDVIALDAKSNCLTNNNGYQNGKAKTQKED